MLILLCIIIFFKQRLINAVYISIKILISLLVILFLNEINTTVIQVRTNNVQDLSMFLSKLRSHTALLVRTCIYRIKSFKSLKQIASSREKTCCIIFLFQIKLLVPLLIYCTLSFIKSKPYLLIISVG